MATTHGARPRVPWWRWRTNPLCRRSDIAEAWLLIATAVLALVLSGFAGLAAAGGVGASLDDRREHTRPVPAVLVEDARDAAPALESDNGGSGVWAEVRWTAPDGTRHTGRAEVPANSKKGAEVTVHNDEAGRLVSAPPAGAEAHFQIAMAGITVAVVTGGMVLLCGWVARARLRLRRLDRWEDEWRQVEPMWRKRMTG
ncbi:Rv1733c family protein [Streptomyces pseudogriseolus]|uniref:Rv1733c family protein n=1 Tax=Streptomyces pseudogriseolus TaxID=36817 RepID=UPI003FA28FC5